MLFLILFINGFNIFITDYSLDVCSYVYIVLFYFFFSSRRRHTRLVSDWSSDVCSSDLPLLHHRLEVQHLLDEVVELDAVVVEDHAEIVEVMIRRAELGRGHRALPDLPLLDLAVPEHAVDVASLARELEAEGHPHRDRQPLAE